MVIRFERQAVVDAASFVVKLRFEVSQHTHIKLFSAGDCFENLSTFRLDA